MLRRRRLRVVTVETLSGNGLRTTEKGRETERERERERERKQIKAHACAPSTRASHIPSVLICFVRE
jgi:hypothetical protein